MTVELVYGALFCQTPRRPSDKIDKQARSKQFKMSPTIVLITGANRGIGRGLLERYIAKPNHIVIAANRDPKHSTSTELLALPTAEDTTVKVVKLDVTSETDGEDAARELKELGINHVDILIANAAIGYVFPKLEMARLDDIRTHFETNVIGFARTYQAFFPFLQTARDRHPKLVTIGSSAAFFKVCFSSL